MDWVKVDKIWPYDLTIRENRGNGDCMFIPLTQQLELLFGASISSQELRQNIVRYMMENPYLVRICNVYYVMCYARVRELQKPVVKSWVLKEDRVMPPAMRIGYFRQISQIYLSIKEL